jgi:hypothetical protein
MPIREKIGGKRIDPEEDRVLGTSMARQINILSSEGVPAVGLNLRSKISVQIKNAMPRFKTWGAINVPSGTLFRLSSREQ